MDEKIKELIAIGASVAGHCPPCLTYYVDQAKRLGIGADEIQEAVSVGRMVEKGAMSAMNKFARSVLGARSESPAHFPQEKGNGSKTLKAKLRVNAVQGEVAAHEGSYQTGSPLSVFYRQRGGSAKTPRESRKRSKNCCRACGIRNSPRFC